MRRRFNGLAEFVCEDIVASSPLSSLTPRFGPRGAYWSRADTVQHDRVREGYAVGYGSGLFLTGVPGISRLI